MSDTAIGGDADRDSGQSEFDPCPNPDCGAAWSDHSRDESAACLAYAHYVALDDPHDLAQLRDAARTGESVWLGDELLRRERAADEVSRALFPQPVRPAERDTGLDLER